MAEQTQQFAGQLSQVVLTDPAQASDANPRVLAKLTDMRQSLGIISQLALGDQTALAQAGVETRGAYDTQAHEWAIGRDRGDPLAYYLIAGGPGEVNWTHAALTGLESVAHSHPFVPGDRSQFVPDAGPQVVQTLTTWMTTNAKQPIPLMPDDLWYLFPSNQDLVAGYVGDFKRSEVVYSPYQLAPDGRLSRVDGGGISVKYGPVLATLNARADAIIKDSRLDAATDAGVKAIAASCIEHVWCALGFLAGHAPILTGFMHAAPKNAAKVQLVEFAWFHESAIPANAMTCSQLHEYIRRLKG